MSSVTHVGRHRPCAHGGGRARIARRVLMRVAALLLLCDLALFAWTFHEPRATAQQAITAYLEKAPLLSSVTIAVPPWSPVTKTAQLPSHFVAAYTQPQVGLLAELVSSGVLKLASVKAWDDRLAFGFSQVPGFRFTPPAPGAASVLAAVYSAPTCACVRAAGSVGSEGERAAIRVDLGHWRVTSAHVPQRLRQGRAGQQDTVVVPAAFRFYADLPAAARTAVNGAAHAGGPRDALKLRAGATASGWCRMARPDGNWKVSACELSGGATAAQGLSIDP
ncbi:MAG TPA: hypothetical protein VFQ88_05535 [Nevskiaceae bacterium]|nr:hypothetical protein [Nevskiaceae bacterium]